VAKLELGMKRLATGDLDTPIDIQSRDEMGLLAETFNAMAQDIKRYRENMENWTQSLQEEVDKKTAEIVRAQEQMINAEKLASLGRMAAGVAHELNSPLTGILTFTHLLKDRTPPDRKQDLEDMDLIIEQSERCTKIIKGMLGFARKGASESMDIDVNELLDDTVEMVRNQVKFHNVQIWMEFVENIPPLTLDPNQLQQVFLNLLTNAADAMNDRGSISIATRVVGEDPERSVEIEFTDTGPGIYPNNLAKIFEPFFTTKPVGQGTGLGLPVSYGIVKKHGGDITVKSKVGEGTSFFVHLPLKKAGEETG
jgi:two-component system NtrC family sensor kinase